MKPTVYTSLILLFLCSICLLSQAQPGRVDSSFGVNGIVIDESEQQVEKGIVSLPDKKLLIGNAGFDDSGHLTFRINRLLADGSTDVSYGNSGALLVNLPRTGTEYSDGIVTAMLQLPGGKIMVAGNGYSPSYPGSIALARLLPDGTVDSSFGIGGSLRTGNPAYYYFVEGIAAQPDGKFLLSGQVDLSFADQHFYTARFLPDGSFDSSFGTNGTVISPISGGSNAVTVTADGSVFSAGFSYYGNGGHFHLEKLTAGGLYDSSFGINGMADDAIGSGGVLDVNVANDVALQPDGKILLAGRSTTAVGLTFTVVRYTQRGVLDASFGNGGIAATLFCTSGGGEAVKIFLSGPDKDKIVVAGSAYVPSTYTTSDLVVVKYLDNGNLDPVFGNNGVSNAETIYSDGAVRAVMQTDGKYIVSGVTFLNGAARILARFDGYQVTVPLRVRIRRWLNNHILTWDGLPANEHITRYTVEQSSRPDAGFTPLVEKSAGGYVPEFSFTNSRLLPRENYYRIKAVNREGLVLYSEVVSAGNASPGISVNPNPAASFIVAGNLPAGKRVMLVISNANGVKRMQLSSNGTVQQRINVGSLGTGTYYLTVVSEGVVTDKVSFFRQ